MKRLLWLDMEMTGLDVDIERVIEVAVIVTDMDFNPVDTYHAIVKQPQVFLDNMDDWNRKHHTQSGLVAKIPEGKDPELVDMELRELTLKHFDKERAVLCGNSIFQDRKFIDLYFKNFEKTLHYRMLDVTSWKIIMNEKYDVEYQNKDSHRALDDIRESIEELKTFLKYVKNDLKS
ncbi:MAG: oligoribonuclease [Bdellovibrionaceae bacterium]|nr:oligoribonuclease [Pseudobdellovibrionaceae bacterium]